MHQEKTRPWKLILVLTLLIHACQVCTYHLSNSPSPSPANNMMPKEMSHGKGRRGSSVIKLCKAKCNECEPCMPVEVSIRRMGLEEEYYYYPQVWKCMCGHTLFSP
ncbi:hypothetical protein CsatB_005324 [Cannabis sativa]